MTSIHRVLLFVWLSATVSVAALACGDDGRSETPEPAPEPAPEVAEADPAEAAALERARQLAKAVGGGLKARLTDAMAESGPAGAVRVCAEEAQQITARAIGEGEAAGRASTKLRNPENAGPGWVRTWLAAQGDQAADAAPVAEVVDAEARVIVPIAVEGVCLTCHGAPEAIAPEVTAVLTERYPEDEATGYEVGDLRGALWARVDVTSR